MKKRVVCVPLSEDSKNEQPFEETTFVRIGRGRAVQVHHQTTSCVTSGNKCSHAENGSHQEDPVLSRIQYVHQPQIQDTTVISARDTFEESSEDDIPTYPVTSMYTKEELAELSELSHSETEFVSEPKNEGIVENRCRQIEARIEENFFAVSRLHKDS